MNCLLYEVGHGDVLVFELSAGIRRHVRISRKLLKFLHTKTYLFPYYTFVSKRDFCHF
jgi:hypothetical protein